MGGTGVFENLRTKDGLATVSTDDNAFECHIRTGLVRKAQFARKETPDKVLRIVRLLGEDGKSLLSAILAGEDGGAVEAGSIQLWNSLRERFGEEVELGAG